MFPRCRPTACALLVCLALAGMRASPAAAEPAVRVLTSIPPLAMLVAAVGGDRVEVRSLLPAGADPHTFEPRPSDARAIASAHMVVSMGTAIDEWIDDALQSAPQAAVLRLEGDHDHGQADHHGHDLHVWLDPRWVRDRAVPAIHLALATADPAGAARYGAAARSMREKMMDLEDDIREFLQGAPTRWFFSWHPAWGAFAERFALHAAASLGDSEGREPSLSRAVAALRAARAAGVRAVLVEPQADARSAAVFAGELGLPLVTVDPLGDPASVDRSTYIALMKFNMLAFAKALGIEDKDDDDESRPGSVSGLPSSSSCQ